eukprot:539742_1
MKRMSLHAMGTLMTRVSPMTRTTLKTALHLSLMYASVDKSSRIPVRTQGTKAAKNVRKRKNIKMHQKNVLDIRDFMNGRAKRNKNRTSSSSSQKAEQSDSNDDSDMSSGQMPRSDSNDNDDDDDDDNHRTHADDNHRTHPHAINTAAKWKFVL